METENHPEGPMRSGNRLEIAVNLALASMRDGPGAPKASRITDAGEMRGLAEAEGARLSQVYAANQRRYALRDPGWSYVQEVESRIDNHLQRQRAGRTC